MPMVALATTASKRRSLWASSRSAWCRRLCSLRLSRKKAALRFEVRELDARREGLAAGLYYLRFEGLAARAPGLLAQRGPVGGGEGGRMGHGAGRGQQRFLAGVAQQLRAGRVYLREAAGSGLVHAHKPGGLVQQHGSKRMGEGVGWHRLKAPGWPARAPAKVGSGTQLTP